MVQDTVNDIAVGSTVLTGFVQILSQHPNPTQMLAAIFALFAEGFQALQPPAPAAPTK